MIDLELVVVYDESMNLIHARWVMNAKDMYIINFSMKIWDFDV
jgi:hypothetical protein